MPPESIVFAADHAGYELKNMLKGEVASLGYDVLDLGTDGPDAVDYPDYADALAMALEGGRANRGVLVCGTGIGVSIAANRYKGVRAALCQNGLMARFARQHNDANVLVMGARLIGVETAMECLQVFLNTEFEGGRHARRVAKMS